MTRVKICGLTTENDLRAAVEAGADAVGVVVDVPVNSPREIRVSRAERLLESAPPMVSTVLVTMPDTPERVLELAERIRPDSIQLHGNLSEGDTAYISTKVDARVVKSVDASDPTAKRYDGIANALLVDSVGESGSGGTGRTNDWNIARKFTDAVESPVILAGGLTPENVREAVETVNPFAVDVASGVEVSGGTKDQEAVREFVSVVKQNRAMVK